MSDLPPCCTAGDIAPLASLTYTLGSSVAALRQLSAARHVGKVVVADRSDSSRGSNGAAAGHWIISGGTGALGALAAKWLVAGGARHVVLLGRAGLGGTAASTSAAGGVAPADALAAATAGGAWAASVTLAKCDAAAASDAAGVLATTSGQPRVPLAGVLHAGGVLRDATLPNQTLAGLRAVAAPKVAGTSHLAASAGASLQPLAATKLFSSTTSALGNGGQANYAAANAALEATAARMQQGGLPGVAVSWGAWAGVGMAAHAGLERMERMGYGAIRPSAGMAAIASLVQSVGARTVAAECGALPPVLLASVFYWRRLKADSQLFSELRVQETAGGGQAVLAPGAVHASTAAGSLAAAAATPALSAEAIQAAVTAAVAEVLGSDPGLDTPLIGAGLDSLGTCAHVVCLVLVNLSNWRPSLNTVRRHYIRRRCCGAEERARALRWLRSACNAGV